MDFTTEAIDVTYEVDDAGKDVIRLTYQVDSLWESKSISYEEVATFSQRLVNFYFLTSCDPIVIDLLDGNILTVPRNMVAELNERLTIFHTTVHNRINKTAVIESILVDIFKKNSSNKLTEFEAHISDLFVNEFREPLEPHIASRFARLVAKIADTIHST